MDMLVGVVIGVIVAALARIVRAEFLLPKVLGDLTVAVQKLHGTASHLQAAIEQLCDEWLAEQAQQIPSQEPHAMKGSTHGSNFTP